MSPTNRHEPAVSTLSNLFSEDRVWIDYVADQFESAWQAGGKPEIKRFLGDATGSRRLRLLLELVQIDWSCRSKAGERRRAEDYLAEWQELQDATPPLLELLRCEQQLRMASREPLSLDELKSRFPNLDPSALQNILDQRTTCDVDESTEEEPLPQRIGPYTIRRQLGRGGFGRVLLGRDEAMDIAVAIKVPGRDLLRSARARDEFLHEVRHVARLRHDAIVRALTFGGEADGDCYIAYEFIEGESLADRLKRGRPAWGETVQLVARIADALHYAHLQGVVHRDIKPANILLDRQGRPYVADFGLAVREENLPAERGRLAGTRHYMAPEQVRREGHRVSSGTDIFSLGVVLYEMLTGQRPFRAASQQDLFEQIQFQEPRAPRTIDDSIPREVERICLKALSKRMSDRYTTASDLAEELRLSVSPPRVTPVAPVIVVPLDAGTQVPQSHGQALTDTAAGASDSSRASSATPLAKPLDSDLSVQIVPKGLRSFDAADADFFLELLPGPRDRDGLPESIRFWKRRIEVQDPDDTFRVGLIYGPSGCGKSSLVKAGLLPRLAQHVTPIYVEATGDTTETRLLRELEKRFPDAMHDVELCDGLTNVRVTGLPAGKKLLIVLDQFEQWLHAKGDAEHTELAHALRQCDGGRVQCLVMVRDDFWMAATRFMADLEVNLVQGQNCSAADLFNPRHARKVLTAFGRAFGALPEPAVQASADQDAFVAQAVDGLAREGKIICVRLALFAEMVKGKAWTPLTMHEVGGTEGVGITFLEETFSAATANPKHRLHQKAARAVLRALLPEQGTDIKGRMRTREELRDISGYGERLRAFDEVIQALDGELRLITPTDPEGAASDGDAPNAAAPGSRYYQLTHDYLVPAIREWLTRKQKETWRGRAELRLAERTAQWTRAREGRFLPNPLEYVSIVAGVPRNKLTPEQKQLVRAAGRRYEAKAALLVVLVAVLGWAGWEANGKARADGLVRAIRNAQIDQVPALVSQLAPYRRWAGPGLALLRSDDSNPDAQLRATLALLPADQIQAAYLEERLLSCSVLELPVIRDMLRDHAGAEMQSLIGRLRDLVLDIKADSSRRFNAALALATYEPDGQAWNAATANFVIDSLLSTSVESQPHYRAALQPARLHLVDAAAAAAADPVRSAADRLLATDNLVDFGRDRVEALARTLVVANERQFPIVLAALRRDPQPAIAQLKRRLEERPQRDSESMLDEWASRNVLAAVGLLQLGERDSAWQILRQEEDPRGRSYWIHHVRSLALDPQILVARLVSTNDNQEKFALLQALGEYDSVDTPAVLGGAPANAGAPTWRKQVIEYALRLYRDSPRRNLHAASRWLLTHWGEQAAVAEIDAARTRVQRPPEGREWFTNSQGLTMMVVPAGEFRMGSAASEPERDSNETQHAVELTEPFAISDREISRDLFEQFNREVFRRRASLSIEDLSPAVGVNWYQALAFCRWLSDKEGIDPGENCLPPLDELAAATVQSLLNNPVPLDFPEDFITRPGYRLPTEAEWEYACRAGAATRYNFGNDQALLARYAWYTENSGKRTRPGGQLKPNDWGLFDMHGNAAELCLDFNAGDYGSGRATNPVGPVGDQFRRLRGGGWSFPPWNCRSAYRTYLPPTERNVGGGFRVVWHGGGQNSPPEALTLIPSAISR